MHGLDITPLPQLQAISVVALVPYQTLWNARLLTHRYAMIFNILSIPVIMYPLVGLAHFRWRENHTGILYGQYFSSFRQRNRCGCGSLPDVVDANQLARNSTTTIYLEIWG